MKKNISQNLKLEKSRLIGTAISLVLFAGIIVSMFFVGRSDPNAPMTSARKLMYARAWVTAVLYDDTEPDYVRAEGRRLGKQELEVEILSGLYKGDTLPLTNYLSLLGNVYVSVGDKIVVQINSLEDNSFYATMHNYDRGSVIGVFVLLFALLLIGIGGLKGLKALLGLVFTLACIWFLMIPLIMRGLNPILVTIAIVVVTTAASLLLLDGFTRKSAAAILGCVSGVAAAGIIAAAVGAITPINGFNMSDAEDLILHATDNGMQIKGLLICGVLISALGAVMDVAMTISSAVHELHILNPELKPIKLFKSGMNIGRDAMGTMANTLILAFAGSSLNMFVLVRAYDIPFIQLINADFIVIEILQSVAGSIGIVLTVPLVSLIASYLTSLPIKGAIADNRSK